MECRTTVADAGGAGGHGKASNFLPVEDRQSGRAGAVGAKACVIEQSQQGMKSGSDFARRHAAMAAAGHYTTSVLGCPEIGRAHV